MIPFSDADVRHREIPVVNVLLIGLNALVFLYEIWLGGFGVLAGGGDQDITVFFLKWGFIPQELSAGSPFTSLLLPFGSVDITTPAPTWATLFSSMFIHGGVFHFAGNMAFLWVFGDNIEGRLGHVKYLGFYLVTGLAAALCHLAVDSNSQVPLVGASGAVSGVMGAYLLLYPYNRIRAVVIFLFITVIQLQAMYFLGIWFLMQVLNAAGTLGLSSQVNVAFMAHIGGFACGAAIIAVYKLLTGQPIWPPRGGLTSPWDNWYRTRRGPD